MGISYKRLFKLLIDRGLKRKDIQEAIEISCATVTKLSNNECVRLEILIKICSYLGVTFDEIMEIVPGENVE